MVRAIMVATDFSERSDCALRRGAMLARETGAQLIVVHAIDDNQPRDRLEAQRDRATAILARQHAMLRASDRIACEYHLVFGPVFSSIAKATLEHKVDLLVIGPHRRQMLRDIFVGTTAGRAVRSVQCPVLMSNAIATGQYRRLLFATDLSDPSRTAIQAALALGIARDAVCSLLYVFDAPALRLAMSHTLAKDKKEQIEQGERVYAERRLAEFAVDTRGAVVDRLVHHGTRTPAVEILNAAEDVSADLVVIGTHGRTGVARFLLGSVAEAVLGRADRDVLAVPPNVDH